MITGQENTMALPITDEQMEAYNNGALVQDAFPHLTPDQREFIMTGILPDVWDAAFAEED